VFRFNWLVLQEYSEEGAFSIGCSAYLLIANTVTLPPGLTVVA
jgi:hypothetical protein